MESSEQKLADARRILQEWVDQQGHDRCWYYPDVFERLVEILEVKITKRPSLPPLQEFKRGCELYQKKEYDRD